MPVYGFSDKSTAETLKRLANGSPTRPAGSQAGAGREETPDGLVSMPNRRVAPIMAYLIDVVEEITEATLVGGELTLGSGTARILRRVPNQQSDHSYDQAQTGSEPGTQVQLDPNDQEVLVRVWNSFFVTVRPTVRGPRFFATQDQWGNFFLLPPDQESFVEITSDEPTGGFYDGIVLQWVDGEFVSLGPCKVKDVNG